MVSIFQHQGSRDEASRTTSRTTYFELGSKGLVKIKAVVAEATQLNSLWDQLCGETTMSQRSGWTKSLHNRAKQRCDQCMHDLRDEKGLFIQKATGLGSNAKFTKTAIRCSGHRGQAHAHLQGQAPNGLLRTAMAAVYPRTMCQRMKYDIIQFLNKRNLMKIKSWPSDLAWFTTQSFYECVRCTLGRACPKDIEHSMIPGQCRHGKWATGTNPRINKLEDKGPTSSLEGHHQQREL